jgi:hypothetical protein
LRVCAPWPGPLLITLSSQCSPATSAVPGRLTPAGADIKARSKELVKRHHPDANGGDRTSEDKLREIIEAYNYLKKTGFC